MRQPQTLPSVGTRLPFRCSFSSRENNTRAACSWRAEDDGLLVSVHGSNAPPLPRNRHILHYHHHHHHHHHVMTTHYLPVMVLSDRRRHTERFESFLTQELSSLSLSLSLSSHERPLTTACRERAWQLPRRICFV
ncbi:uncharacterized protein K489DRAFT_76096 [Dissoconium aciculare CBS 342.82]|uniref:Uncharacterized protein n=1 Tax=Dissoconium aciculare CBS 342.82 TaxID=1314786 RepID=A0A6J3LU69_9PEZI|nr:uncharacterized protein K489DRAFT_76096 [Dissoconium aciculare CBS 342.82]KAF1819183.1 hypothetical protein K489DRAFT_76096 [Dissoconium aciculare CBS 342.82]